MRRWWISYVTAVNLFCCFYQDGEGVNRLKNEVSTRVLRKFLILSALSSRNNVAFFLRQFVHFKHMPQGNSENSDTWLSHRNPCIWKKSPTAVVSTSSIKWNILRKRNDAKANQQFSLGPTYPSPIQPKQIQPSLVYQALPVPA